MSSKDHLAGELRVGREGKGEEESAVVLVVLGGMEVDASERGEGVTAEGRTRVTSG